VRVDSAGASLNEPPTTTTGAQFSGDLFSRHPPGQQPSFLSTWGSLYGLSLPIMPFQDPLYTALGPFSLGGLVPALRVGMRLALFCRHQIQEYNTIQYYFIEKAVRTQFNKN